MPTQTRVLVAAKHVALDRTSEGLCTVRFLQALAANGYQVRCITSEGGEPGWHCEGVDVRPRAADRPSAWARIERHTDAGQLGGVRARVVGRGRTALTVATGRNPSSWLELASWRSVLSREITQFKPDVVVARGGGLGFEIHHALAGQRSGPPWVAHLHDPYPSSAYPPSYAERTPLLSASEERATRRFLRRAAAVTVPSDRLARWMATRSGVELTGRTVVLPHIGGPSGGRPAHTGLIDELCGDRPLILAHTGTLLRQRSPLALLRALDHLAATSSSWATQARVVLMGRVDRHHLGDGVVGDLVTRLETQGCLRIHDRRTDHATALALASRAAAALLIEAGDPESPFFPAKLADYIALGRPVVALTPTRSVVRDLLGSDYPLLCDPGDPGDVERALRAVDAAWRGGQLGQLTAPPTCRDLVSAEHGRGTAAECIELARRR